VGKLLLLELQRDLLRFSALLGSARIGSARFALFLVGLPFVKLERN